MFDILMDTQVVGNARVDREGLYYRFTCTCTPPDSGIHRIRVSDGNNTKDLGICVPTGTAFSLVSRVPIKYLPGDKLSFTLVPKEKKEISVPVATGEPFAHLDELEAAHLNVTDSQPEIVIDSVPDQQDSDPSQESPHIWEQP